MESDEVAVRHREEGLPMLTTPEEPPEGVDLGLDSTDVTNTGGAYSWWTLVWHHIQ